MQIVMNSIEINRDEFKRKIPFMVEDLGLSKASVNPVQYDIEDFNFAPKSIFPKQYLLLAQVLGVKLVVQMDSILEISELR